MLSVGEGAEQLGVSPARVRALIKDGRLPAVKNGREWVLREEDVLQRLADAPRAGRPRSLAVESSSGDLPASGRDPSEANAEAVAHAQQLYDACRRMFGHAPAAEMLTAARSREEASFYMAVFDFFLQQRQRELVREGVF